MSTGNWIKQALLPGLLLSLPALIIFYFTVLQFADVRETRFLRFNPQPDAVEYAAMADSLIHHGSARIHINAEELPSRYPPGYSLLTAAYSRITGTPPLFAVFEVNRVIGLLLILATGIFLRQTTSKTAALISTLCLATAPGFISYVRAPMAEMTMTLFVFLLFGLLYRYRNHPSLHTLGFCGLLTGLSLLVRMQGLFLTLAIAGVVIAQWVQDRQGILLFKRAAVSAVCFAIGTLPLWVFQFRAFGHPLANGYSFWVPVHNAKSLFQVSNLLPQLQNAVGSVLVRHTTFDVAHLFGPGTYLNTGGALLAALSLAMLLWRKETRTFTLILSATVVPLLLYRFISLRFFLPHLLLILCVSGWAVDQSIRMARRQTGPRLQAAAWALTVILMLLSLTAVLGLQTPEGALQNRHRSAFQLKALMGKDFVGTNSPHYELARRFQENCPVPLPDVVLFSDANPVLVDLWIEGPVHTVPAQAGHAYRFSDEYRFGEPDISAALDQAHAEGKQIYFLQFKTLPQDHPSLSRHRWDSEEALRYGSLRVYRLAEWNPSAP